MVLNGNTIQKYLEDRSIIEDGKIENIHSSSYDLTSEDYILKFKHQKKDVSFMDIDSLENMYEKIDIKNGYKLKPKECIVIPIKEKFNIPNGICGMIRGRTSFNRLGIFTTIQHLNPGFIGSLNITIVNNSTNTYILEPNTRIVQVVFEKLDKNVSDDLLYYNETGHLYNGYDNTEGSHIYSDYIGKVVRHFKGNYYYIENICMDSESKELMIIYRNLYDREDSNIWIRPAKMFFEEIDQKRLDNITKQKHRFEVVNNLTIDYTKRKD